MAGCVDDPRPVLQPRLLRLSAGSRRAWVWLWLGLTVVSALGAYVADEASQLAPDQERPPVPWYVWLTAGAIGLPVAVLYTRRWRWRVDEAGLARRVWRRWELWPWEAFSTGQIRKVEHRLDQFKWAGAERHRFRKFSLGALDDANRDWLAEIIAQVWVPPALPPPPEACEFSYWDRIRRPKVRLDAGGLTIQTGRSKATHAWTDVQSVRIRRLEHDRPEFEDLQLELPARTLRLRVNKQNQQVVETWRGAKHFEIVGVLNRYVAADRIQDIADYGPPRDRAEARTRIESLEDRARKTRRLETGLVIGAATLALVGCPLLVRFGVTRPDLKGFLLTTFAVLYLLKALYLAWRMLQEGKRSRQRMRAPLRAWSMQWGVATTELAAADFAGRRARFRCSVGIILAVVIGVGFWWVSPVDLSVPPRRYPPDNAYPALADLAQRTLTKLKTDARLHEIDNRLGWRSRDSLQPEDRAYLLAALEPVRAEYGNHLHDRSLVTLDYRDWESPPEARAFRLWTMGEAARLDDSAAKGDSAEALDAYETVLRLSEQIRRGGLPLSYLTGNAMQTIGVRALAKRFEKLDAPACDRLVALTRAWLQYRVPPWEAVEQQKWQTVTYCREMYHGRMPGSWRQQPSARVPMLVFLNFRWAARETSAYCDRLAQELRRKPVLQQSPVLSPESLIALMTCPIFQNTFRPGAETRLRLAACSAAVRAFHLRQGRYPAAVAEAGVADLNVDPYAGQGFVYRVSDRGFLLYSIGANGRDDGGARSPRGTDDRGDITLYRVEPERPNLDPDGPLAPPVWTE